MGKWLKSWSAIFEGLRDLSKYGDPEKTALFLGPPKNDPENQVLKNDLNLGPKNGVF